MSFTTLRPSATPASGTWTLTGAATHHAAQADESDASYSEQAADATDITFDFDTFTLGTGTRVLRVFADWREAMTGGSALFPCATGLLGTAAYGFEVIICSGTGAGFAIRDKSATATLPFGSGQTEWLQADLDGLRFQLNLAAGGGGVPTYRLYRTAVRVELRARASVTVQEPSGIQFAASPIVEFTADMGDVEDAGLQRNVHVRVFSGSDSPGQFDPDTDTPVIDQITETTGQSVALASALPIGAYVVFVRVSKDFDPDADGEWYSEWAGSGFSVSNRMAITATKHYRIGCGKHRVFIQEQGADVRLFELPHASLGYGRVVDGVSSASVELDAWGMDDPECARALSVLTPWQHEIVIARDEDERGEWYTAWVGPVVDLGFSSVAARIDAKDLSQWFARRVLPTDRPFVAMDLADIFNTLVLDAMAQDPRPGIVLSVTPTGILGDRTVAAHDRRRASDDLDELARTGVDYTMFGPELIVGGREVGVTLPRLDDKSLADVSVSLRGMEAATQTIVVGAGGGPESAPISAVATGDTTDLGLVQRVDSESTIEDIASAQVAADTRQSFMDLGVPTYISARLTEDAPFSHQDLIPGARVPLAIGQLVQPVAGMFRLRSVSVSDGPGGESITVEFVPLGSEDE